MVLIENRDIRDITEEVILEEYEQRGFRHIIRQNQEQELIEETEQLRERLDLGLNSLKKKGHIIEYNVASNTELNVYDRLLYLIIVTWIEKDSHQIEKWIMLSRDGKIRRKDVIVYWPIPRVENDLLVKGILF